MEEQETVKETIILGFEKNILTKLKAELHDSEPKDISSSKIPYQGRNSKANQWYTSWWHQFRVLLVRGMKEKRHEALSKLKIFQVISVAFLGGLLWWHTPASHIVDRISLLFSIATYWTFSPVLNAVFTFPQEKKMLIKEMSSGMYRLSSYFMAQTFVGMPLELILPTAFTVIMYWMGGLNPSSVDFLLSLLLVLYTVLVSQSLGLALGALLMDVKRATTLAAVIALVFVMGGGFYIQNIPPFVEWMKYVSCTYYCYKLLLGVQYKEDDVYECSKGVLCKVWDFKPIRAVGVHNLWIDVSLLTLMLVGYRLIAYLALRKLQLK